MFLSALSESTRTLLRNIGWLAAGEVVNRGSRFLFVILLARHLGTEQFGQWSFAIALVSVVAVLSDFGFPTLAVREIARSREAAQDHLSNVLVLKAALAVVTIGIVAAVAPALTDSRQVLWLAYILSVYAVLDTYGLYLHAFFRAEERMEFEALLRSIQGGAILALGVSFVLLDRPLVFFGWAFVWGALLSVAVGAVLTVARFGPFVPRVDLRFWLRTLQRALPIVLSSAAFYLNFRIDTIMLSVLDGDRATGLYNVAYNFLYAFGFAPILLANSVFPRFAREREARELTGLYVKVTVVAIGFTALLALALFVTRHAVFLNIFGEQYRDSLSVYTILLGAVSLYFLALINYAILWATGRDLAVLTVTASSLVLNVALNALLIPRLSYDGAGLATLATEGFVLVGLLYSTRQMLRVARSAR